MPTRTPMTISVQRTPAIVAALSTLSVVPILVGQLTGAGLNPLLAPISQYVYLPGGYLMVLAGAVLLGGCGLVLAHDLYRRSVEGLTGVTGRRIAVGLLISYAISLTLVGLVPTDPPGSETASATEIVHRIGVVWSFLSLPIAGLIIARTQTHLRTGANLPLVRCSAALLVGLALFVAVQLPLLVAGSGIPALGIVERIAFVLMIGYLIFLATALRTGADQRDRERQPAIR